MRRRIADVLAALDELVTRAHVSAAEHAARRAVFEHRLAELDRVAPPVRWHRRLTAQTDIAEHPANWIELTGKLRPHAQAVAATHDILALLQK